MYWLVFYEDIYQNARSNHEDIIVKFIAIPAIKELPTFYGLWCLQNTATGFILANLIQSQTYDPIF
jgi:hypothetical protein